MSKDLHKESKEALSIWIESKILNLHLFLVLIKVKESILFSFHFGLISISSSSKQALIKNTESNLPKLWA